MTATKLGPWENRSHHADHELAPHGLVAAHLDATYWVQRYQYAEHPDIDHLMVARHDGAPVHSWADLQAIKDRLAPDGQFRYAIEIYPPTRFLVDAHSIYHLWVMAPGWTPGVGLHPDQDGFVRATVAHTDRAAAAIAPAAAATSTPPPDATVSIPRRRRRRRSGLLNLTVAEIAALDDHLEATLTGDHPAYELLAAVKDKLERLPHTQPDDEAEF